MTMLDATTNARALGAALAGLPMKVRTGVAAAISLAAQELRERVEENLSGDVLNARSGALKDSIVETVSSGDILSASVGSDGSVPYVRIQEFGGRIAIPEIVPRAAKVLAFPFGGRIVFAAHTAPHEVDIPERSYLRSALEEESPAIAGAIRDAISEALS